MTWILLTQVQEIRSVFGSEFTLMSIFGTMELFSYVIWSYYMLPISKYWSQTFWSRHGDNFVYILALLRDISPRWGVVFPLLDNMNTWFFCRGYFLVINSLSMIPVKIILLFWYRSLQRVQMHQIVRWQVMRWLILWEMVCWRQWNEKMVKYVMSLILAVRRNIKWVMILNICMIQLKKIQEINYTYGYLKRPMAKNILWRVTIFYISQIMGERGRFFIEKLILPEGKEILHRKWGRIFWLFM